MNKKTIIGIVAVVALLLIVSLVSRTSNRGVSQSEEGIQNEGAQDQQQTSLSIPADMPETVEVYPGSTVLSAPQENNTDAERNISLSLGTSDSVSDVISWYRSALSRNGWTLVSDKNIVGYDLLEGENGNVKVFIQAAKQSEGQTVISQRVRVR